MFPYIEEGELTVSNLLVGWSISSCFFRETRALLSRGFSARSIALKVGVATSVLSTSPPPPPVWLTPPSDWDIWNITSFDKIIW